MNLTFIQNNIGIFLVLVLWELAWKGFALWKAARNKQKYWFIALFLINTAGVLPIAYLLIYHYRNSQSK